MKLEGTFLRSRVARRVWLLFLLAAFIPFIVLSILYFRESNQALLREAHIRLQTTSASFRSTIYDRLLLADQLLRTAAGELRNDNAATVVREHLSKTFRNISFISPQSIVAPVFDDHEDVTPLSEATAARLRQGGSVLTTGKPLRQGGKILLIQAVNPVGTELQLVVGEIDPAYLWGTPETFPYATSFCVLNNAYTGLHCPPPFQPESTGALIRDLPRTTKGEFTWEKDHETYLANFSEVFLQARFFTSRWIVVAAQPEAIALGRSLTFNLIFWGSVAFSVLLVTLLSLTQIRRTLVPLEQLIDGTRRVGKQDFNTKVKVVSADEFGELADSFNAMVGRLGRQFKTLKTLSNIDRAILSELDMDQIVESVLLRLRESLDTICASISIMDHDSPDKVRAYLIGSGDALPHVQRYTLPIDAREMLRANSAGLWMTGESAGRMLQGGLQGISAPHFFLLPILWKDQLFGVACLGFAATNMLSVEDVHYIRDFADRVGVALSTAAREGQLYHQARTDALTELPNRFFFVDQLRQDIAQTQRGDDQLAVLFIDLDRFKSVNDSLGHSAGDELLREAAARLRQCVREGDTVARLGGDEFTILINPLPSTKTASVVAEHVLDAMSEPFLVEGLENVLSASIGIAVYPSDGASADELMRNADTAMYRAKDSGRGTCVFFEESMNAEVVKRSTLERELRHAISEQQFILHYQPQVDPRTKKVHGVEALLRWRHPERGIVGPNSFVLVAEETGLIAAIGEIVLIEACAQFTAWRNSGLDLEYVAVNVSSRQFREANFVQFVESTLRRYSMPAECLELEITESLLLTDANKVVAMLSKLKTLGVRISIDDFGTGYSSLGYLERLPFDTLKIDISFIRKIHKDGEGGTIAATIMAMAHSLGKRVVAEGVETQAQVDFLRKLNCELVQGYIYSRPLPPHDVAAFVNAKRTHKLHAVLS